jgi:hypothetical protein
MQLSKLGLLFNRALVMETSTTETHRRKSNPRTQLHRIEHMTSAQGFVSKHGARGVQNQVTTEPQDKKDAPSTVILVASVTPGGISPQILTTCPPGTVVPTPEFSDQIILSKTTETVEPLLRQVHVGTNRVEKLNWSGEPDIGFNLPNFS